MMDHVVVVDLGMHHVVAVVMDHKGVLMLRVLVHHHLVDRNLV